MLGLRKGRWRWGLVFVLSLILVLTSLRPAFSPVAVGSELDERKRELEQISKQIEQKTNQLDQVRREQKSVTSELNVIEADIDKIETEIQYLNKKAQMLNSQINTTRKELEQAQMELQEQTEILGHRLKSIYQMGEVNYLEVLLDSTSFSDFLTRFDLLQKITEQDMALIQGIEKRRQYIAAREIELETALLQVKSVQEENREKQDYLQERSEEKGKVLASIKQERAKYERALDELENTSRRLEKTIRDMQSKSPSQPAASGGMIYPVNARISSEFGMRPHPILKTRRMHNGVDFAASKGTSVKAAQSGTVICAGWQGGYGQTVIINHGGGISTLYAHLSRISVRNGQEVARGAEVGKVGSTGLSTGPHLHFEVRVNGSPTNPRNYLK